MACSRFRILDIGMGSSSYVVTQACVHQESEVGMQLNRMITVVGAHADGEVGRVITGGILPPRGNTMFERMENLQRKPDWIREVLLFDPRGSAKPRCRPSGPFWRAARWLRRC
jgi:Proline racemase